MLDGEDSRPCRNLGRSLAWLLHCIQAGREAGTPSCPGAWSSDELHPLKDAAKGGKGRQARASLRWKNFTALPPAPAPARGAVQRHLGDDGAVYPAGKNSIVTPSEVISAMG